MRERNLISSDLETPHDFDQCFRDPFQVVNRHFDFASSGRQFSAGAGVLGRFYSALVHLFRGQEDCIMFSRDDGGFCAACRAAIEKVIWQYAK